MGIVISYKPGSGSGGWGGRRTIPRQVKVKMLVTELCPTLCDPIDCSPPGSSVCGILQAEILEWGVITFSRGPFWLNPGLLHCRQILYCLNHHGREWGGRRKDNSQARRYLNKLRSISCWEWQHKAVSTRGSSCGLQKDCLQSSLSNQGSFRAFPRHQNSRMLKSFRYNFCIAYAYSLNTLNHI